MSTSIGKIAWVALTFASALSAETIVQDDFESSLPGTPPKHWRKTWGNSTSDQWLVNAETAAAGNHALQYQRTDGNGAWQSAIHLPNKAYSMLRISFAFQLTGKANDARYTLRLRCNNQNAIALRLCSDSVSMDWGRYSSGKLPIAPGNAGQWHRVALTIPTTADMGNEATLTLSANDGKELGKKVGQWQPTEKAKYYMLWDFSDKAKNTTLAIDDFRVENLTQPN